MTTITFPEDWYKVAGGSSFRLVSKNFVASSPWTGRRGASGPLSQLWAVKLQLVPQRRQQWMSIEALFAELGGQSGKLYLYDFAKAMPQRDLEASGFTNVSFDDNTFFNDTTGFGSGMLPQTISVAATAYRGEFNLTVGGLPASTPRALRRGDNIEIRRSGVADGTPSLHMLIRDADTDTNGETTLQFRPTLRKGVAIGDMVVLEKPCGYFRLVNDEQAEMQRSLAGYGELGFELIEAII